MKCRAETVRRDKQTETVTRVYGKKCLEAIQSEAALLILGAYPWFRRQPGKKAAEEADRMKLFFDGQARICSVELNDNAADTVYVTSRRLGRHEADRDERFEEVTNDAEFMLSRRLADAGIDAAALWDRAEGYLRHSVKLGSDALHWDARVAWYGWLGRRAVRIWIAAASLSLLEFEYPGGRRRFSVASVERDFAVPLADFASGWITSFIAGEDRLLKLAAGERARKLRDEYNVDLKPVDPPTGKCRPEAENAARVTRIGGNVPKTQRAAKAPEEFEKILADVQAGRGVGIFPGRKP